MIGLERRPWVSGALVVRCACGAADLVELPAGVSERAQSELDKFFTAHERCAPTDIQARGLLADGCELGAVPDSRTARGNIPRVEDAA